MKTWWQTAQEYERSHTATHIKKWGITAKPGNLSHDFFPNDQTRLDVTQWASGKTCLEVGCSVCPNINGLTEAKSLILIEPMADQFREQIYVPENATLYAQPGEEVLPQLEGTVDGLIVCRNCIDHAQNPLALFDLILKCAMPGCYLLHWSDVWHFPVADEGHRDITKNPKDIRDFVVKRNFDVAYEFSSRFPDFQYCIDYGCLARRI